MARDALLWLTYYRDGPHWLGAGQATPIPCADFDEPAHRPEEDLDPRGIFAAMRLRGVRPDQVAINPRNAPWT